MINAYDTKSTRAGGKERDPPGRREHKEGIAHLQANTEDFS